MRSAIQCAPRAGFRCDRHGVPRLPARCSGPARGPAPARPALGCGDPSLLPRSRCARSKRSPRVAFRPCSAHAADGPRTAPFGGSRGLHHSAVSRAVGSRSGLPNAPSGSPSEALRSPSRWAGKICIAAYKPSFLRFARRTDLALRLGAGEGEPLATARSRRAMNRSLWLAPIDWLNGPSVHRTRWQRVHGPKRYPRRRTP